MATQITIQGRLVQGGVVLKPAKDMKTGQPKKDDQGKVIEECFMAIAVPKNDPNLGTYYAAFLAESQASFPHLFPNGAQQSTHPRFAMKWQDGDGTDSNGKSVAGNEGFAGHWIIKCSSRFAPNCYERNAHGQLVQLTDPEKVIKRGYYVAVGLNIAGNGVEANNAQAVPGLYVSPNLVLYVQPGQEIISGPDPNAAFAGVNAQPSGATPPSNLAAPALPAGPGAAPALPVGPSAAPALPAAGPGAVPAMPGAGLLPPPATKRYIMQPSAQGATREALLGNGWTDEQLVAAGHMVIQG